MPTYKVLITDVTCYGNKFCVAGWDINRGKMIRPEPSDVNPAYEASRFWDGDLAGPGRAFSVGNMVKFEADRPPENFPFPHATEDRIVMGGSAILIADAIAAEDIPKVVAAGVSKSLYAAFDKGLTKPIGGKASVPREYKGRSLGAIEIQPRNISFYTDAYFDKPPKLKARIDDGGVQYHVGVTAEALRTLWKRGGLDALSAYAQGGSRLHIRIGLSRPFHARPDECFPQVNGIILY
jgi:hypothetical protein